MDKLLAFIKTVTLSFSRNCILFDESAVIILSMYVLFIFKVILLKSIPFSTFSIIATILFEKLKSPLRYFANETFVDFTESITFLPKILSSGIAVTVAAQAGMLPFLAWYFNFISLVLYELFYPKVY